MRGVHIQCTMEALILPCRTSILNGFGSEPKLSIVKQGIRYTRRAQIRTQRCRSYRTAGIEASYLLRPNALKRPDSRPRALLCSVHTLPWRTNTTIAFTDHRPNQTSWSPSMLLLLCSLWPRAPSQACQPLGTTKSILKSNRPRSESWSNAERIRTIAGARF